MELSSDLFLLLIIFFLIATVYSSAGFGGGSSYIAVLSLFPMTFVNLRMIALICNIVVVTGSVILFHQHGYLKLKRIWPLILLSIPMAYLGGLYRIDDHSYYILLGICLIIAALVMLSQGQTSSKKLDLPHYGNGLTGGVIGLISGVVGIGGGIFLSPVLYISKWGSPKIIAATTALFILVNSVAGLTGQIMTYGMNIDYTTIFCLALTVMVGGQLGSRLSIFKFNPLTVKKVTAVLILVVAIRILCTRIF